VPKLWILTKWDVFWDTVYILPTIDWIKCYQKHRLKCKKNQEKMFLKTLKMYKCDRNKQEV